MWKNYLLVAIRNLKKNPIYSIINVLGLAVGLSACILIGIFVSHELSYDQYHENSDRIFRVTRDFYDKDGNLSLHLGAVAPPIAPLLKQEYPEIEEIARILPAQELFKLKEQTFLENDGFYAEPSLFQIFDISLIKGNSSKALKDPNIIYFSKTLAQKMFNLDDPIGKTLHFQVGSKWKTLKVGGVFEDFPQASHFHPHYFISFKTLEDPELYFSGPDPKNAGRSGLNSNWGNNAFYTYMLLSEANKADQLAAQLPNFIEKYFGAYIKSHGYDDGSFDVKDITHLHVQALKDIHLNSRLDSEIEANGNMQQVYIFSIIAAFILLIAAINFVNLATARSAKRAREVGVRKVIGANRARLIGQFLGESVFITALSGLIALGLVEIFRPQVALLAQRSLSIAYLFNPVFWLSFLGLIVGLGMLAGLYPALYLSSFQPVKVLKSNLGSVKGKKTMRRVLVLSQFAISCVLIISTIVVYRQLSYINNKPLGLNKEQVVRMGNPSSLSQNFDSFREELLSNPAIKTVARSSGVPSNRLLDSFGMIEVKNRKEWEQRNIVLKTLVVDPGYFPAYEIPIVAGRNFEDDYSDNKAQHEFIINELAARELGWKQAKNAVGKRVKYARHTGTIVGIVKDHHFESVREEIKPLIYILSEGGTFLNNISVRVETAAIQNGLSHLEKTWKGFSPEIPFNYNFMDENFARLYEDEQRQGKLYMIFAILAISVASLGLFGLATYIGEQRTSEIGIRKVLGANTWQNIRLLSQEFIWLVLLANALAIPLAWYFMQDWLRNYAYRIELSALEFVLSLFLSFMIVILSIGYLVIRLSRVNPVQVLRNE